MYCILVIFYCVQLLHREGCFVVPQVSVAWFPFICQLVTDFNVQITKAWRKCVLFLAPVECTEGSLFFQDLPLC